MMLSTVDYRVHIIHRFRCERVVVRNNINYVLYTSCPSVNIRVRIDCRHCYRHLYRRHRI